MARTGSLGGFVAQVLAIKRPKLLGKPLLVGTMPPRGSAEAVWSQQWLEAARVVWPSMRTAVTDFCSSTSIVSPQTCWAFLRNTDVRADA
jgi:pimeloyl-ACP methyl ester carboxylesterase